MGLLCCVYACCSCCCSVSPVLSLGRFPWYFGLMWGWYNILFGVGLGGLMWV